MAIAAYTDNQDGTGITAAISGSDPADIHDVYILTLIGKMEDWQFVETATRTGDGDVGVAVSGAHFVYVLTTTSSGTVLSPVQFGVASGIDGSVHYRSMEAIQARLKLLNLEGISNENIVIRKLPSDRGTAFEASGDTTIVISPPGVEGQSDSAGTNARDDIQYPVVITILRADNQDLTWNLEQGLLWRQKINRAFRQQRLEGVDCIYKVRVQPGPVTDQNAFWSGRYHSSFILRLMSREPRGI